MCIRDRYKEYTRPLEQQIDTDKNIFSVLDERANRTPNDSLVEYKNEHGEWSSFSATEFRAKVIAIAKGLIAQGIMPGESVSIISHTCWQWTCLLYTSSPNHQAGLRSLR